MRKITRRRDLGWRRSPTLSISAARSWVKPANWPLSGLPCLSVASLAETIERWLSSR
jgi:hypothetical protein